MTIKSILGLKNGAVALGTTGFAAQLFATGNPVLGAIAAGMAIFFIIWKALGDNRFDKQLKELDIQLKQEKEDKKILLFALKNLKECENIGESVNTKLSHREDLAKAVDHLMEKFNNGV